MSIRFTIGLKVFITFMVIALGISWYLVEETPEALAKEIDKGAEEVMVDTANLLSQVVTFDIKEDKINIDKNYLILLRLILKENLMLRSMMLIKKESHLMFISPIKKALSFMIQPIDMWVKIFLKIMMFI